MAHILNEGVSRQRPSRPQGYWLFVSSADACTFGVLVGQQVVAPFQKIKSLFPAGLS